MSIGVPGSAGLRVAEREPRPQSTAPFDAGVATLTPNPPARDTDRPQPVDGSAGQPAGHSGGQPDGAVGEPSERSVYPGVWWLTPGAVVLLVVPGTIALAWHFPDEVYRSAWRTPKSFTPDIAVLLLGSVLVFLAVSVVILLVARRRPLRTWPQLPSEAVDVLRRAQGALFVATLVGYAALLAAGLSRGARPAEILGRFTGSGQSADLLKSQFAPITGVTSLTQMGIGFAIVTAVLLLVSPQRGDIARLVTVLLLALARSVIASERLALIEVVVPLLAVAAWALAGSPRWRGWVRLAPLALVPLGFLAFSLFEYGRSWAFYSAQSQGSFFSFAAERFAGYYATAYNNGAILLTHTTPGVPYLSVQGIWEAPGVAQAGGYELFNSGGPLDTQWLWAAFGNPEFNNPCGVCLPTVDFGLVGGAVFMAVAAALVTWAFVAFANSHPVGLLVYPALFTGLWELPRYLYWTQGRLLPVLGVLLVVGFLAAHAGARQRVPSGGALPDAVGGRP